MPMCKAEHALYDFEECSYRFRYTIHIVLQPMHRVTLKRQHRTLTFILCTHGIVPINVGLRLQARIEARC